MKGLLRRGALALAICVSLLALAAAPAVAQVESLYTGVTPPAAGAVLGSSGERAVQGQVLSLQVSGGVAGAQQARVGGLAFTGADIATMVLIGLAAMAVGGILVRRGRPRPTSEA